MSLLKINNFCKRLGGKTIVDGVSMQVQTGEVVGLLGPNGAGKTTCFYMIAGLVSQDQGDIFLDHHCLSSMVIHQRAQLGIGYLPQEPSIFRGLTVTENLLAVLELQADLTQPERLDRVRTLLKEFHLESVQDTLGVKLSGGERRRVEIARALACTPHFMLLDEPFAGVDPISVNEIKQLIDALKHRGLGVLITDHNVRATLEICDRAYILGEGRIIASGSSQEVLSNQKVKETYLGEDFIL